MRAKKHNCVFCRISEEGFSQDVIFEDDLIVVIKDRFPRAPMHFLIIPKKHIERIDEMDKNDKELQVRIFETIKFLSKKFNLKNGFRIIINTGSFAGQSVDHLHIHLLSGEPLEKITE